MPLSDFRTIYLPYCIEHNADGSWLVLNREYKPVGFNTGDQIKYEDFPVTTKFKELDQATLEKLSYSGEAKGKRVYLYNDGTDPLSGAAEMEAYLKRIEILSKLRVAH
jgi:hypothetical protein